MPPEEAKLLMPFLFKRQAAELAAFEAAHHGEGFLPGPGSAGSVDGSSDGRPSSNEHAESILYSLQKENALALQASQGGNISEKERHLRQMILQEANRRKDSESGIDPMEIVEDHEDDDILREPEEGEQRYSRDEGEDELVEDRGGDAMDEVNEDEDDDNIEVVENDDEEENTKKEEEEKEETPQSEEKETDENKNDGDSSNSKKVVKNGSVSDVSSIKPKHIEVKTPKGGEISA